MGGEKVDTREAIVNRIRELCDDREWKMNKLSNEAGVPPSTVKNIMNGTSRNPGVVTVKKLCDAFEITLDEFFATAEFRNLEQEIK